MKENKTYTIKNLSEEQLKIIMNSLEAYTRMGLLQFYNVIDEMFNWKLFQSNSLLNESYIENWAEIEHTCKILRNLLSSKISKYKGHANTDWSLGIGNENTPKYSQISYEMESDIRKFLTNGNKDKLKLTEENDIIIEDENQRKEKIIQLLNKFK